MSLGMRCDVVCHCSIGQLGQLDNECPEVHNAGMAGSWEALGAAVCVADLDTPSDAAPQAENCPNSAMSTLTARLRASVSFRRRLLNLSSSAQLPEDTLGAWQILLTTSHLDFRGGKTQGAEMGCNCNKGLFLCIC